MNTSVAHRDFRRVLAKRWVLIFVVVLLVPTLTFGTALLTEPTYKATAQLFVSTQLDPASTNEQLLDGGSFSAERVKSYIRLGTSREVLAPVVDDLGLDIAPEELARQVSLRAPVDTVLIDITATSTSSVTAAAIANGIGTQLGRVIEELERPSAEAPSPVKAKVATAAFAPAEPASPNPPASLVLGLIGGLVLAAGIVALLESMDSRVEDVDDLARTIELPVLASIARGRRSVAPILRDDPGSRRGEAYRHLRTNLAFAAVDDPPRMIVVTSAVAGEGKSSVAGNLALSLAQIGRRVCLVDGDLRQPSLANYLGLVSEVGLTTVLAGAADLADVLQPVAPNLVAITSGIVPPNPSELLSSERAGTVLRQLARDFDMVIVDAPPTLPVTDATVLARTADAVLLVVRARRTTRRQVETAVRGLGQVGTRVLGVVLNFADGPDDNGYGYGRPGREPAASATTAPDQGKPSARRRGTEPPARDGVVSADLGQAPTTGRSDAGSAGGITC